jgi:DNA-binding CsgD family transcriptional regulator
MRLAAFDRTVASIYDAVSDDTLIPAALKAVAEYVGAPGAAYLVVNKLTNQVSSRVSWGSHVGSAADYLIHYSKIDRFRVIQEKEPCGSLVRLSESLPESVLRYDEWYNDFIRAGGSCDLFGGKLSESASHVLIFGLHRAIGDAHAVPRDMDAFQRLMVPLCGAARLRLRLIDAGLDQVTAGMVFVDSEGRIVETNQEAERILHLGDGLTIHNGHIRARRTFETAKLTCLIAKAASAKGPSDGCLLIGRDGGQPAYVVKVAPAVGLVGYNLPMAVILISALRENHVSESELAQLYGLSRSESRLAMALEQGKRLTALPDEFGVKITTLRTQLSSILRKCGAERQSDLVHLISNISTFPSIERSRQGPTSGDRASTGAGSDSLSTRYSRSQA